MNSSTLTLQVNSAGGLTIYGLQILAVYSDGSESVILNDPTPYSGVTGGTKTYSQDFSPYMVGVATALRTGARDLTINGILFAGITSESNPAPYAAGSVPSGVNGGQVNTSASTATQLSAKFTYSTPGPGYFQVGMCQSGATCLYK